MKVCIDHKYFLNKVFGQKNTIDLNEFNDKGELLTAYKRFFMGQVDEIREKTVFSATFYKKVDCQENFFMITMSEPLDWMLVGMRLALAFVFSDNEVDYILTDCTWNKSTYYNQQKLSTQRSFIVSSLIKICENPMINLSKGKIYKQKDFMEKNKESFNMCFWKGEICKVIVLMYEIIRESIKVMEHMWEFYPNAFTTIKSVKTLKKPTKKVHFQEVCSSQNLKTNSSKKLFSAKFKNVSLPKILVNNDETSKVQPKYVKNNNFIMPKCPFKSCKENPEQLKNTIFASEADEKTSISCSTGRDTSLEKNPVFKYRPKKDAFDYFSKSSSKSYSKSKVSSLVEIPDEFSLNKSVDKTISKSVKSNKNIRIMDNKMVVRSLADFNIIKEEKGKKPLRSVQNIL